MAETIQELLQENLGKVQELQQTSNLLRASYEEHLAPLGSELSDDLLPSVEAALEAMRTLKHEIPALAASLGEVRQEAHARLQDVDQSASQLQQATAAKTAEAEQALRRFEGVLRESARAVDSRQSVFLAEVQQLGDAATAYVAELAARTENLSQVVDQNVENLGSCHDGVQSDVANTIEIIDSVVAAGRQHLGQSEQALSDTVVSAIEYWGESASKVDDAMLESQNELRSLFTETVALKVEERYDVIERAVEGMNERFLGSAERADTLMQNAQEQSSEARDQLEEAGSLLESARTAL
jgi:ABC-type transporter Mla subunit MlaD